MKKIIIILSLLLLFLNFLHFPTSARELTSTSDSTSDPTSSQRKSTSKTTTTKPGDTTAADSSGFGFDFGNIPDFSGNGWSNYGGGGNYGGGYGSGYGGPGGGYSHHGVVRPSVVCTERGPCYKKRVTCPAKCFTSYSHSGKNGGGGGGGGGCSIDCKKHCVGYC
ncbi:glycine-rich protein DOT1-like [Dioscorea cayenensis subsp. rotundata]|uniref:Glycine-rich protein DOT1-like n=1 Tax=Dioscorea cayennensis subsp. rotundata TaxID=55577 RepID=A0AB40BWL4_DIOCR|nr:glycine-rich protein DOT1-like [Dioscorea cayenensis subsp. rotundata]